MEKTITTLTCLSAALVAGNAYADGCGPACGGGDHHSPMSHPDHAFSGSMEGHVFRPSPMERPAFTPIHPMERPEFRPIRRMDHEFSPIRRMEHPEFTPIHRMEERGFHSAHGMNDGGFAPRMERRESRPMPVSMENHGFRSVGQRGDFRFKGHDESRSERRSDFRFRDHGEFRGEHRSDFHFRGHDESRVEHRGDFRFRDRGEFKHHRQEHDGWNGWHEVQHRQHWEQHPHQGGGCHNSGACTDHQPHHRGGKDGDYDHSSHHYQFIPAPPSPHWGMGGSYNEWHVIDVGVPYTPPPKVVKAAPKAQHGKQKFVRSAPYRPHCQQVAQTAPANLCNLRYQYPTISHKKGGFYTVPASTCATTTVCITVACNNPPRIG